MDRSFTIGPWRAEPSQGVLLREEREVRLEPRLMDLLALFADAPGRVIGKDEIVRRVWAGRAIGDDTLAAAVSKLRTALGETASERFIETLPKRGYRLLVAVDGSHGGRDAQESPADDLVQRGTSALRLMLPPALAQAKLYFDGAIERDPKNAAAHAGLAETLIAQAWMGQGLPHSLFSAAKSAARAAVSLDADLAAGWSVLGLATLLSNRDFSSAEEALQRALALNSDLASARRNLSFAFACIGRFADAEREARRAVEIEPLSLSARNDLLQTLIAARRYGHAVAEAKRTIALGAESFQAWAAKGWAHAFMGEERDAVAALLESLKAMGTDESTVARLARTHVAGGFPELCAAGADLFEGQRVLYTARPLDIAMLRTQAGQLDSAFAALERAAESGDPVLLLAPYLPHLDRLRNDPRFPLLLERVRLVH